MAIRMEWNGLTLSNKLQFLCLFGFQLILVLCYCLLLFLSFAHEQRLWKNSICAFYQKKNEARCSLWMPHFRTPKYKQKFEWVSDWVSKREKHRKQGEIRWKKCFSQPLIFHSFIINIVRFNGFVVIWAAGVCHKITRNSNAARNCYYVCVYVSEWVKRILTIHSDGFFSYAASLPPSFSSYFLSFRLSLSL